MMPPDRKEGFTPIASYAALGDGRTAALLASEGRLDWWPLPTLDAPPVCAAILDPGDGGYFQLAPIHPFEVSRHYVAGTNVLSSTFTVATGTATVLAALNTGSGGRLPWSELAYRIVGVDGEVEMRWELVAGDRFGTARPWVSHHHGTPVVTVGNQLLAVVVGGAEPDHGEPGEVRGHFRTTAQSRVVIGLVATDGEPLFVPAADNIDRRIDRTIESWKRWSGQVEYGGRWEESVRRSALALKVLLAEASGAIAAAATTSLPERLGGPKNWDYRYAWTRDSSFTLDALISLGLDEEVHRAVSWLLAALRLNGPDIHVFYTLDAGLPGGESDLEVPGYAHSRPVRAGNSAADQIQLGTYGDLFDTVHRYVREGHVLDIETGRTLADLADRCCDQWTSRDSGIWELPNLKHYTISKIGCWVALDRAVKLATEGQIPSQRAERWRDEAGEIRRWIHVNCWSEQKQSYTFYAGTDDLDAAVLLAGRTGFDTGVRLAGSIEAVAEELGRGPLVYRYSGAEKEEGAFVACTYWMVEALVHTGQPSRATALMDEAVRLVNDVGLLSEQIDPLTGEFLGNVPQGLSHLALINAACTLEGANQS